MSKEMKKILIIEDERPIARALELKLKSSGLDPHVVTDGEAALAVLETEAFDLILSDLVMPNMDGFGLLQALKERQVKTPVVILSNLSQEDDEGRARELGAVDFFIKSNIPIADIITYIKKLLQ